MNTMTAAASRMWMRPPIVYEVNIPSIHNAIKTTRSVGIMLTFPSCVAPVVTSSTHQLFAGQAGQEDVQVGPGHTRPTLSGCLSSAL